MYFSDHSWTTFIHCSWTTTYGCSWTAKKPTPPTKSLVEWIFWPFMNVLFMALSDQNRWPKVSFNVFMNACMELFLNWRSFPVAECPQIRWRTTCSKWLLCCKYLFRIWQKFYPIFFGASLLLCALANKVQKVLWTSTLRIDNKILKYWNSMNCKKKFLSKKWSFILTYTLVVFFAFCYTLL